ncbi:hypothetical protein TeGR_g4776 [Tetraparma gracilis]|uniref:Uncharacterized protein n=1 Tax=Tetraparma gracilis TaxID=2962635 RepID=A0ABQ6MU90_9STRA|nr:hypothetical protein TeGR_g4776 [Tetraparma gracilis]
MAASRTSLDLLQAATAAVTKHLSQQSKSLRTDPDRELLLPTAAESSLLLGRVSQVLLRRADLRAGLLDCVRHDKDVRRNRYGYRDSFGVGAGELAAACGGLYDDVVPDDEAGAPGPDRGGGLARWESLLAYFVLSVERPGKEGLGGVGEEMRGLMGEVDFMDLERLETIAEGMRREELK